MDETSTWFNEPIKKTVDFIGAKEILLTHNEPNNRRRITIEDNIVYLGPGKIGVKFPEGIQPLFSLGNSMLFSLVPNKRFKITPKRNSVKISLKTTTISF